MSVDIEAAQAILDQNFAPWILALKIEILRLDKAGAAILAMPAGPHIAREGGIVCGQASMAMADTAMVFAIIAASGGYRPMTTVTQSSSFLRSLRGPRILATATLRKLGRTLAFGDVALQADGQTEIAVQVTSTYAILGPVQ